ncbi:MAG: DUF933 domain-containing protein [Puniceicoccales bacterium]|nr:DUF933 domain-containing protein [Puniceicoccales bacterium]
MLERGRRTNIASKEYCLRGKEYEVKDGDVIIFPFNR